MSKIKILILFSLIMAIILIFTVGAKSGITLENFQMAVKNFDVLSPIIFILIYTLVPTFFIPITPLSITAGVLFGPFWGTVFTVLGSTLGGCLALLVSRYLMKDWVDKRSHARVILVQEKVKKEGWKFVAFSRIMPLFPFNVQNYIFGLTSISLKTFFFSSLISLIPGSFAYVYLGYAGKNALQSGSSDAYLKLVAVFLVFIIIAFLPNIISKMKRSYNSNLT